MLRGCIAFAATSLIAPLSWVGLKRPVARLEVCPAVKATPGVGAGAVAKASSAFKLDGAMNCAVDGSSAHAANESTHC
jgi:hypothetical protein